MHIYYEAKALDRTIDAAPRITPSTKSVLKKIIRSAPAAEVEPVIHAHWVQTSDGVIYCSNCGAVCGIGAHIEEVTEDQCFCYHCGAKMDLEE